jgi:hypothetical protein
VNLFDFFFDLVAFGARRFELRIEFGSFLFQLLDALLIRLGISLLLDGMVVLITRFFQLALDEFDFLVDLLERTVARTSSASRALSFWPSSPWVTLACAAASFLVNS